MEGAAEVFESTHAAQTTLVPDGGATSRAKTKEDKLGFLKQVRVQGGSRARSIAAGGIVADATCRRHARHHTLCPNRFWVLFTRVRGRDPQKCSRTEFSGIQGTPGL
jgi:hypothetical protein